MVYGSWLKFRPNSTGFGGCGLILRSQGSGRDLRGRNHRPARSRASTPSTGALLPHAHSPVSAEWGGWGAAGMAGARVFKWSWVITEVSEVSVC